MHNHNDNHAPHAAAAPPGEHTRPEPQPAAGEMAGELPEILSHADMDAAFGQGLAKPLGDIVGYAVNYQNAWWIPFEGGWARADADLSAVLDAESARMTTQDALVARNAAIRAAMTLEPEE